MNARIWLEPCAPWWKFWNRSWKVCRWTTTLFCIGGLPVPNTVIVAQGRNKAEAQRLMEQYLKSHSFIKCDRCNKIKEGRIDTHGSGMSSGCYLVDSGYWHKFANEGEKVICDYCMFNDPRYVEVYGNVHANQPVR